MSQGRFSKKALRHAQVSAQRTRRMLAPRKSAPIIVSYLPGFEPPTPPPERRRTRTRFPFVATINGVEHDVTVRDGKLSVTVR